MEWTIKCLKVEYVRCHKLQNIMDKLLIPPEKKCRYINFINNHMFFCPSSSVKICMLPLWSTMVRFSVLMFWIINCPVTSCNTVAMNTEMPFPVVSEINWINIILFYFQGPFDNAAILLKSQLEPMTSRQAQFICYSTAKQIPQFTILTRNVNLWCIKNSQYKTTYLELQTPKFNQVNA